MPHGVSTHFIEGETSLHPLTEETVHFPFPTVGNEAWSADTGTKEMESYESQLWWGVSCGGEVCKSDGAESHLGGSRKAFSAMLNWQDEPPWMDGPSGGLGSGLSNRSEDLGRPGISLLLGCD